MIQYETMIQNPPLGPVPIVECSKVLYIPPDGSPLGTFKGDPHLARFGPHRLASTCMNFKPTCFRPGFRHRFSSLLDGFWPPTWAYFGSFLSNFSVLSWWSILKSILNKFVIDFWPPWHIKNWAPAYTGIKFSSFLLLILSSLLDSILAPKTHPKSSPRCSKIPSDMGSKF